MLSFFCTEGGPSDQEAKSNGNDNNQEPEEDDYDMYAQPGQGVAMVFTPTDCLLCDVKYIYIAGCDEHARSHHTETAQINCDICGTTFYSENRHKRHIEKHKDGTFDFEY